MRTHKEQYSSHINIMNNKIHVFDFFSGCGGTSKGFEQAGCTITFALDSNRDAAQTFQSNFPETTVFSRDIHEVNTSEISDLIESCHNDPLLFCGCAPCQPFTKQKTTLKDTDERRELLKEFQRFVRDYLPHYIFIENVPGIQKTATKGPFTSFVNFLRRHGYRPTFREIYSQNYGVPQYRKRLVLLASRLGAIEFPEETCNPAQGLSPFSKVSEWIADLPAIKAGETHPEIPNHRAARLSPINLQRIKATPQGGNRLDWPKRLWLDCHKNGYKGHTDVYGRMKWDSPSTALTTRCISLSNGRFGHPDQDRAISIREAACIQTFPRDFTFYGNLNSMARQIGNAVPVQLAKIFATQIINHYEKSHG